MKRSLCTPPPLSPPQASIGRGDASLSTPQAPNKKHRSPSSTWNDYIFMLPFPLDCLLPDCSDEDVFQGNDNDSCGVDKKKPLLMPRRSQRYTVEEELSSSLFCPLDWPGVAEMPIPVVRPMAVRPPKSASNEESFRKL